jgi:hypothetical protein
MASNPNYHSFLLRVWRDAADQPWRASLQFTSTEEKFAFADLQALFAFLVEQLMADDTASAHSPATVLPAVQLPPPSTEDSSVSG